MPPPEGTKRAGGPDLGTTAPVAKKAKAPVGVELTSDTYRPTLADVQNLLLRVFTSEYGENPRWICIRGMNLIRTGVVLLVPCLDTATLEALWRSAPALASVATGPHAVSLRAPDIEHDVGGSSANGDGVAQETADVAAASRAGFLSVEDRVLRALLSARAKPAVTHRKQKSSQVSAQVALEPGVVGPSKPPIAAYLASAAERARSGYPERDRARGKLAEGWIAASPTLESSAVSAEAPEGSERGGLAGELAGDPDLHHMIAMDCEMVLTASGQALARISIVDVEGSILLDTLVLPEEEVTDYVTEFSGITQEKLAETTTTLKDVQTKVLQLISDKTILVGHSLENDLQVLKLVHERVIDTCLIYPHQRCWPQRHGLAGLSNMILKRKMDRKAGHDSVQDAQTAMELALLKVRRGPGFGAMQGESVPLGRLLRTSGTRLSVLQERSGSTAVAAGVNATGGGTSSSSACGASRAWHFEGCQLQCGVADTRSNHGGREVKIVVFSDYEDVCRQTSRVPPPASPSSVGVSDSLGCAEAAGTRSSPDAAGSDRASCLEKMDEMFSEIVAGLGTDELLVMLSGYGDLHALRALESTGTCDEAEMRRSRSQCRTTFLAVEVGGGELRKRILEASSSNTLPGAVGSNNSGRGRGKGPGGGKGPKGSAKGCKAGKAKPTTVMAALPAPAPPEPIVYDF